MQGSIRHRFTHQVEPSVVSAEELRAHTAAAQNWQLLLSAVHVTGDVSLLDRYAHRLGPSSLQSSLPISMPDQHGGEPAVEDPLARDELIEMLAETLSSHDQAPYVTITDPEIFQRMSDIAFGGPVDRRHVAMNMEQAGFVPDQRAVTPRRTPSPSLNVAIVGAGMTGLDAAVKATDCGFTYEILEMESGLGGLWFSQTYPGVAVDTPATYYSLSWEITPEWSKLFPLGDEYRAYLTRIAEKYGITDHISFDSEVTRMRWLEPEQVWELTVQSRRDQSVRTVRASAVITAAGHLNRPKYPEIEGIETFRGESVHTARWRPVDVAGKRVGVVGCGAAGVQVIASLTPDAEHLTVFQRQPHWISKNTIGEGDVDQSELWLRRHLPFYLHWTRFWIFAKANSISYAMNATDKEWRVAHPNSISSVNEYMRQISLDYIHQTFGEGSELAQKLTPEFAFGAKRPVRDPGDFSPGGYYWSLAQEHVDLVTSPLARVVPDGLVTADGQLVELDVIVWATGMTLDFLSPIDIIGRDDVRLSDVWAGNDPRTYLGGTVPGFPNLFVQDGPNTGVATGGTGHNFMTETLNHYIFECLQLLVERDATSIEVTRTAHDEHNELIEELMGDLIWNHERGADTYYRNEAGRIILPSPFEPSDFWRMNQRPDESKFVLLCPATLESAAG
jgi:cation diffusion facilitator CzcD-associated flavoprotein CzcO